MKKGFVELKHTCGFVGEVETFLLVWLLFCSDGIIECVLG